jgi:DNA integrity scanning protein DisA with diadenylate cyclase activity
MLETEFDQEFLKSALTLAAKESVHHLLCITDADPLLELSKKKNLKTKLIIAVSNENLLKPLQEAGIACCTIPPQPLSRLDKIKVALAAAINAGMIKDGEKVLCLSGKHPLDAIDTMFHHTIGEEFEERTNLKKLTTGTTVASALLEIVLKLATEIGHHGYEGIPIGTIFTVGDSVAVMEKSRQMVMNPFQGYPEAERTIFDVQCQASIKGYAMLDGAFVIRDDGVVLAAGRYLLTGDDPVQMPLGLGSRHAAAASITKDTKCMALAVSQSTGTVRIFKEGTVVIEVHQSRRRV